MSSNKTGRDDTGVPTVVDRPAVPSVTDATANAPDRWSSGYTLGSTIGAGGMGEVVLARDERIGRDVAIKRMRGEPSPSAKARFIREAKIQARLEHPAIVPVHELGVDDHGQPYLVMKRLAGVTLAELLRKPERPSRAVLLRAFTDVCKAIAFAHSRGIIHRDLKPENIMLGEFGETYVLDWGLARAVGGSDDDGGVGDVTVDPVHSLTREGAVIGTPGYMAPEQVKGESITELADTYALGAILFELLSEERLHPRGEAALLTTVEGIETSPASRRPDCNVPPELDLLCVRALMQDPTQRPSVSELASSVERYVDGDRDIERRRLLAAQELATARAALAADDDASRADAMRRAGRALALDPESRPAAQLVTRLMVEPPRTLPAELRGVIATTEGAVQKRQARAAAFSFVGLALFLVAAAWNGMNNTALLALLIGMAGVMAATASLLSRRTATATVMLLVAVGNATLAAVFSRVFGPLILAPGVTCVMMVSLTSYPHLIDRSLVIIAILVASWLVPIAGEASGLLAATWDVVDGVVLSTSRLIEVGGNPTVAVLLLANVTTFVVIGLFANALARSRRDAQRQLEIQAWHLRQLLPR